MLGQKLSGRYQIIQHLGEGAFGVTFVAEDMQRPGNPKCVVKQFQAKNTDPHTLREARRLFDNEAKILEKLGNHDQIPRLLADIQENEEFYLVQEFIEGHDLSEELPKGKQLSEAYAIEILQHILEVLAFVHHHEIIHRDIKPSNIRRRQDGKIVLIDFGAVKQISTQVVNYQGQTSFTVAIGTFGYMPSEQASCNPQFSSDVYAVGMIGIQALTGIFPSNLPKDSQGEVVWRNQAQVSQQLADIIDKMVRYDFRQRYHSASEALQALRAIAPSRTKAHNQTTVISGSSTVTATTPTPQERSPTKFMIGLAIAAVLAISIGYWYLFLGSKPENFLTYANSNVGIKMKYPQSWQRRDIDNLITGELVAFVSPKQSDADKFQEKLTISVEDFSGTLEDFSDTSTKDIIRHLVKAQIQKPSETTLANKAAYKLIYTGQDGENNLKSMQLFTLRGDKAYVITYTAAIDNYNDFIQTAQTMIKSFEID
ncbi:serine/threonine protein kinase [Tolypothrix sp. NIES-4075]|uniref:serine/threonine-protein kinase n=1 Tax=Tolypothrix sp. NIES-4075 TaxID=2005459 RepID=UPI000B5CA513|nr:serine/threonine-protein kinase [Tolypothrix sp. NIES-4075]GAX41803.1 serine/threonine protein kinase [Tolypothrix sp. NIES-4075]